LPAAGGKAKRKACPLLAVSRVNHGLIMSPVVEPVQHNEKTPGRPCMPLAKQEAVAYITESEERQSRDFVHAVRVRRIIKR
jgi:hypothetical protein